MEKYFTDEINAQIVISLLKTHKIRKVVVSPGATNVSFVSGIQNDPHFEVYSSVDERSASYIACGLAGETGEPVVISCTGATASRNYLPGLTEAFYRKLPVLALTSGLDVSKIGHHIPQVIDRRSLPNDVVKLSVSLPIVKDEDDKFDCEVKVNNAILELKRSGGGPVHINLPTNLSRNFTVKTLPEYRAIHRITPFDAFPELPESRIAIFIGSHTKWSNELTQSLESFCEKYGAVVFCDHTSNYHGKFSVLFSLVASQANIDNEIFRPDILIHLGEVSGDYYSSNLYGKEVWRVNEDGVLRDRFLRLRKIFEMSEQYFFDHYSNLKSAKVQNSYYSFCNQKLNEVRSQIPELPFSNIWAASMMANKIPDESTIHFGILNSLRSWNFFELPHSVICSSNVGGFGIDGGVSTLIGASFADKNKLYFGIIGDLAFFYDMNVIGNRHVGNNIRLLIVNNGKGTEFRNFNHRAALFGENSDNFIAAAGHFGNKSPNLIKNYVLDLGFEYLYANDKKQFEDACNRFLTPEITSKPIIFEIFTNSEDESEALELIINTSKGDIRGKAKHLAKKVLSDQGFSNLRKIIKG